MDTWSPDDGLCMFNLLNIHKLKILKGLIRGSEWLRVGSHLAKKAIENLPREKLI